MIFKNHRKYLIGGMIVLSSISVGNHASSVSEPTKYDLDTKAGFEAALNYIEGLNKQQTRAIDAFRKLFQMPGEIKKEHLRVLSEHQSALPGVHAHYKKLHAQGILVGQNAPYFVEFLGMSPNVALILLRLNEIEAMLLRLNSLKRSK